MSLPSADDLFRTTTDGEAADPVPSRGLVRAVPDAPAGSRRASSGATADDEDGDVDGDARKKPSGRVRHDEKMTVYVTNDELLEIEHARLRLRSAHGLAVDRGRLVREAIALVLADLDEHGDASALVRRLTEE